MGLSIHYSGSFKKEASLIAMINEVKDIAEIYDWEFAIFSEQFPENAFGSNAYNDELYGIMFTPPNCETISLSFLSNGKMCCAPNLMFYGNSDDERDQLYLYMLSTKTQFAGSATHKIIIHLLKYLTDKYFYEFKLSDEGEYWETMDEILLETNFKKYTDLIDSVADSFKNVPKQHAESFSDYFERILKIISDKNKPV
jgi:hypothetical protein